MPKNNNKGRKTFYGVKSCKHGRKSRKHNILLENLPPAKQKLLLQNQYFKWMDGDVQLFEIIFRIEDTLDMTKTNERIVWNPYRKGFSTMDQVEADSRQVDWHCAICRIPIKSDSEDLSMSNFVCDECGEAHNRSNRVVDSRIIESSKAFTKHCRLQLKYDQQRYYYYAEKQSRRYVD